jgi:hypothetical protein
METLPEIAVKILVETVIISGILGYFITKREERLKKTIEEEFKKRDAFFTAKFNFKLRSLEELLAPIKLQLIRSQIALNGYEANDEYREKIIKECNESIRGLLLQKGFLIPLDLLPYAERFISHYDEWLQRYRQERELTNNKETKHVYTYNFPKESEVKFTEKYNAYRKELEIEGSLP